jgi:hypothetical protein
MAITGILYSQGQSKFKDIGWRICNSKDWVKHIDYKSEEWKNLSVNEKDELTKIDSSELRIMSTKDLIIATSDCRSARRIGLFSEISNYYNRINEMFNGLKELLERPDVTNVIIKYYSSLNLSSNQKSFSGLTTLEQKQILEYIMAHPILVDQYNINETNQLLQISLKMYNDALSTAQNDGDLISNMFLLSKLLEKNNPSFKNSLNDLKGYDIFSKSGLYMTLEVKNQIVELCESYMK